MTKEDIEYIEKEKLCFKLYAVETVEKKGKTPIEELININKENQNYKYEYEEEYKKEKKEGIKEEITEDP